MRLEVSPEEQIAFSSAKKGQRDAGRGRGKTGGSYIKGN